MKEVMNHLHQLMNEKLNGDENDNDNHFTPEIKKVYEEVIKEITESEYSEFLKEIKYFDELERLINKFIEFIYTKKNDANYEIILVKSSTGGELYYFLEAKPSLKLKEIILKKNNLIVENSDSYICSADFDKDYLEIKKKDINFQKAYFYLKKIIEGERGLGIYLYSDKFQIGKTHLVSAFANKIYRTKKVVLEYSGTLSKMSKNFTEENKIIIENKIKEMKESDILIFDDFGSEKSNEYFLSEIMMPVLQHRLTNKKTTIFTSNYSIAELESKYSKLIEMERKDIKRFISRICELSEVIEIKS